ncbi:DUF6241 domain-containing protein [Litchfieldia alkalitelluris]|uniref:DUF6241 domain-containing protein n=1 Tax=Litchfieldia alkalitelluris TaxID=304268 RepID=UPI0009965647|nr:DUF6241 domain-containing protein [Litchfieldia alkalitelluris]
MNKINLSALIFAVVVSIGFITYTVVERSAWNETGNVDMVQTNRTTENFVSEEDNQNPEVAQEAAKELFKDTMSESAVQHAIHQMSHQKVKADKKWGAIQLTNERVLRLTEVVEQNKSKYRHDSIYLDILTRWAKGDFSQVDKDHNKIWQLQGGNVGRATGILSTKQEQQFIERNFR